MSAHRPHPLVARGLPRLPGDRASPRVAKRTAPAASGSAVGSFNPRGAAALRWGKTEQDRVERFAIEEFSADQRRLLERLRERYVWWFRADDSSATTPFTVNNNPGRVLCQSMDLGDPAVRDELASAFEPDVLRRALAYGHGNGWLKPASRAWWTAKLDRAHSP